MKTSSIIFAGALLADWRIILLALALFLYVTDSYFSWGIPPITNNSCHSLCQRAEMLRRHLRSARQDNNDNPKTAELWEKTGGFAWLMWTPSWINQKSVRSLDVLTFQVLKGSRKWGMLMSHVHVANEEKWQEPPRRDNLQCFICRLRHSCLICMWLAWFPVVTLRDDVTSLYLNAVLSLPPFIGLASSVSWLFLLQAGRSGRFERRLGLFLKDISHI